MAIAFVQASAIASGGGVDSVNITLNGVTSGNFIAVGGADWSSSGAGTCSDGVSYTNRVYKASSDSNRTHLWYKENSTSGNKTIVFNPGGGATVDIAVAAVEFSGVATSSSTDSTAGTNNATGTSASTGSVTTANADDLLLAVVGSGTGGTYTEDSAGGWSLIREQESGASAEPFSFVYKIVSATGTYSHTWTVPSSAWAAGISAFKAAAGGGGGTTPKNLSLLGVG